MKKIVIVLCMLSMAMFLKADANSEREKLNIIINKITVISRCIRIYANGKYFIDDVEYDLTSEQKQVLINKYNTLKAELKVLVNDY